MTKVKPYLIFFLSWLFPGSGHFLQKKYLKGSVFLGGILLLLLLGILMQGSYYIPVDHDSDRDGYTNSQERSESTNPHNPFDKPDPSVPPKQPQPLHPLKLLGFLGDLGSGILFFLIKLSGLGQGDISRVTHGYGTTYLVTAGLINYLVAFNAFDIARGKRK